jgi:hypothetical protein
MTRKLLATTVIPFFFATAAVAQAETVLGQDWSEATTSAFFADDGAMTLKSEAEIQANWGDLSQEEQMAVMSSCSDVEASMDAGTAGIVTGTTQSNASTFGTATTGTNPPPAPSSDASTGTAADGTSQSNASTFGTATTGGDTPATTTTGTVGSGVPTDGTGQSNASTFGTATTGVGIAQVSSETWSEVCEMVSTL